MRYGGSNVGLGRVEDEAFAVRKVCEKYLANGKNLFWAFMDFGNAYDTIDWPGMWHLLRVYGFGGKLLESGAEFLYR